MQATDRISFSDDWLTIMFGVSLLLLALLKAVNSKALICYVKAFFTKGFIEEKVEERSRFFTRFNLIMFVFSVLVFSLFIVVSIPFFSKQVFVDFTFFCQVFLGVFLYASLLKLLEFSLCKLFQFQHQLGYFLLAKLGYLYNSTLILFPFLILTTYGLENNYVLLGVFVVLFILSLVLIVVNNKNLIVKKLFYFILYLCALEIAPLIILYKITTTEY